MNPQLSSLPPVLAARPSRQRRKEARPGELTAAALALFVENGFAATRLDDIAARAGVSKGTLYLYFDSKEALFKAVIEEGIVSRFLAAEQEMAAYQGASAELLRHLIVSWWQQIGSTPLAGVVKLIISESRNFPEVAQYYQETVIQRGRAMVGKVIARGIAGGEFRDFDVEAVIDMLFAPLLMLVLSRHSLRFCGCQEAPEILIETQFDVLLQGLLQPEKRK